LTGFLPLNYFTSADSHQSIQQDGYLLIKDAVTKEQLSFLETTYQNLTEFPEYSITDKFQNSGRFRSPEIRNFVMSNIGTFSKDLLPSVFKRGYL
jgi:hypothetical protein